MKKFRVDMYDIIDDCETMEEVIEVVKENASYLEEEERNELEVAIYIDEDNKYTPFLFIGGSLEEIEEIINKVGK